jgi:hypothetical protein
MEVMVVSMQLSCPGTRKLERVSPWEIITEPGQRVFEPVRLHYISFTVTDATSINDDPR